MGLEQCLYKTFSTETLSKRHVPSFSPSRALLASRQRPGSSPAALNQMPRCTADECLNSARAFSFGPDFVAELPAVPAPQRVMLHPHQSLISTSRELLAYPWWPCASTRTVKPQESNQKSHERADSPHCVCRHGATVCMHLWAGIVSVSGTVLLPLKHLAYRSSSYSKHCDEEAACGQCLTRSEWLPLRAE